MGIFSGTKSALANFTVKRFWLILVALILIASFLAFRNVTIVLLLIGLSIISKLVEIFLPRAVIFDLSFFTLIVLQFAYGSSFALAVAITAYLIGTLVKSKFTHHVAGESLILPPLGYLIVSFIISIFYFDIFTTGMIALAIYASLMTISYGILYRFPIFDMIIYLVTIIPFNYFVFLNFAEPVLSLLAT